MYLVTNMEGFDYAAETRQGKLVADVAKVGSASGIRETELIKTGARH